MLVVSIVCAVHTKDKHNELVYLMWSIILLLSIIADRVGAL